MCVIAHMQCIKALQEPSKISEEPECKPAFGYALEFDIETSEAHFKE